MLQALKNLIFTPAAAPQQQAVSPVANLREAGRHVAEHADALAELLSVELREYAARQTLRMALIAAAALPACAAWLLLCSLATWLLQSQCGWGWAVAIVAVLNLVLAAALAVAARKCGVGEPAPLTCRELKNDWQCLKLLINGNKKC